MCSLFEVFDALVRDWVEVPVVLVSRITFPQLVEATDYFRIAQVLIVIEVEQNLVARHPLKVDVVMPRHRHLFEACSNIGFLHFYLNRL